MFTGLSLPPQGLRVAAGGLTTFSPYVLPLLPLIVGRSIRATVSRLSR